MKDKELAELNYQLVSPANWDDWQALEPTIMLKKFVYGIYGIGATIATIDGVGSLLTLHGRAVEVSLKQINTKQELHGFDKGNGGLHRTYLFKDFNSPLILRSLSSITDAEAIEVCRISYRTTLGEGCEINGGENSITTGKWLVNNNVLLHYRIYQYLQQQSFATPVFFKGVQYSVETLQELNIITLLKS